MFRNIGQVLITSFGIAQAARIKSEDRSVQQDSDEHGATPPAAVRSEVKEVEIRHCALRNLKVFETMVGLCPDGSSASDSMADALEYYGNNDTVLLVSQQDSLSLAAMDTSDIFMNTSVCVDGEPFNACAQMLPSELWLRQFWRFQDLAQIHDLTPEDKTKSRIFNAALQNHGISHSRLHSQCKSDIYNPEIELVRECVLNSVPAFVSQPHSDLARSIKSPFGDQVDLSNNDTFQQTLKSWLRGMWEKDDEIRSLYHAAGMRFRFGCRDATRQLEEDRAAYKTSIIATQFPLKHSGVTQECHDATPSALEATGTLQRLVGEIGACAGEGANCTEQEHPCPEGFKCDCQRAQREGQSLVVASVLGTVAGAAIGIGVPFLVAGAAGLAYAPEMALTWAVNGAIITPGKPEVALIIAASSTSEFSKSCGCFPLECTYNQDSDQCEMISSETSTASRNPFATVPFNGLKCVEHKSHHWFHFGKQCGLSQCSRIDTSEIGPIMGGKQLFGRVGRSADWGDGVYNCANMDGTSETFLSRLQKIPSFAEESVENTVEGRIAILQQYS